MVSRESNLEVKMKMVKSLFLGSAAGLAAMSGAQAADLPVKAKAVEYVKICSLYGAGFYYIPGTDTCIKIGGYLRADLNIHGGLGGQPWWNGDGSLQDRYANQYNDYARLAVTLDTRTATGYGVVRTFGQFDTTFATEGQISSINVGSSINSAALGGAAQANFVGQGYSGLEFAFVQFAGFTFGKSASAFNTPWHGFPGNNTGFLVGGYDTVTGINNVQYTAQFGNGVSATVGIDDAGASGYNRTQLFNATLVPYPGQVPGGNFNITAAPGQGALVTASASGGNIALYGAPSSLVTIMGTSYSGAYVPDFVGNIKVDQPWGMFQLSGAIHDVSPGYWGAANTVNASTLITGNNLTGLETTGHPDSKFGGAISAALQIKNLPTGAGDDVKVEGTWGLGATKYVLGTAGTLPASFYMTKGNANTTAGTIAIGAITDGVYGGWQTPLQAGVQLTRGWGFRGAFNHNWSPEWSSSLFGGWAKISYNDTAKALWCALYSGTNPDGTPLVGIAAPSGHPATPVPGTGYSCDPGFTMSQIGLTTRWTPVKNLTFSSEVLYSYLKTNMSGIASGSISSTVPQPGGPLATWQYGNVGTVSLNLRVQRNF
jgi:Porin subfamily